MFTRAWSRIRPARKRIYKYGLLGLKVSDDRTVLERLCDWVDAKAELLDGIFRRSRRIGSCVWHGYFDVGLGRVVSSASEIRDMEKKGYVYWSPREMQEHAKKVRDQKQKESREEARKYFRQCIREIKQGRSFVKELREKEENFKRMHGSSIPVYDSEDS